MTAETVSNLSTALSLLWLVVNEETATYKRQDRGEDGQDGGDTDQVRHCQPTEYHYEPTT